jgi:hypothetical protein
LWVNLILISNPIGVEGIKQTSKRRTDRSLKSGVPHFLDVAESLSSDAWLKWTEKQKIN